ncbi:conserved hypothetical protein [Xylanimonas cellulosilytica DSM 15894]|uniref:Phosphoesterase PA-phosphatase related protein n=1 Tax=Xylanimonas cellulosilytica (strain DSM 15894 / JCM 12276 / CECT 5975 / KCTC 9989 / LMG 20990 / NBRC 107835 / XIL07) TaxID=446471 RepID=D1BXR2_XYLCX|nr:hypothetical protein [Xylanimonas cellulosilytica]ACZ31703.1 conserved hypothetical protein [Xylanimonas cellulosilytica DSM 15894]
MHAPTGDRPTVALPPRAAGGRGRLAATVLAGVTAIALLVAARVDAVPLLLPRLPAWDAVVAHEVGGNQDGIWRIMRGGIKYLLPPALLVLVAVCVRDLLARGRRRAAVVAVVVTLGAFGTVEAVKVGFAPSPDWVAEAASWHEMSGHVAAAAAAAVPVLVAVRRGHALVAALTAVVVAGVGVGVVLARWHTVADGVASLVMVTVWSLVASGVVRVVASGRASERGVAHRSARNRVGAAGAGVTVVGALALASVTPSGGAAAVGLIAAAVLLAGAALVAAAAALELGAALASLDGGPTAQEGTS